MRTFPSWFCPMPVIASSSSKEKALSNSWNINSVTLPSSRHFSNNDLQMDILASDPSGIRLMHTRRYIAYVTWFGLSYPDAPSSLKVVVAI